MRKYYELLDISEDASEAEIKQAYRRMASKYHPDRNKKADAAENFKAVKEAYECLSDPERRKIYDETGDSSVQTGNPAEDLFLHLINEVSEHFDTTVEVLEKIRGIISEMLDECAERKLKTDRRIVQVQAMLKALRFKGKGSNFVGEVFNTKLVKLQSERAELDEATNSGKAVYAMLKDYEATDRPGAGKSVRNG